MQFNFRVEDLEAGTFDDVLNGEARAAITAHADGCDPVRIAVFANAEVARNVLQAVKRGVLLENLLVQMEDTIAGLESQLAREQSSADTLQSEKDQLVGILNSRKAQARRMAVGAIKQIIADNPDDVQLRTRLNRILTKYNGI
jgi:uncharacterized coiled-coil protein SlyX